MAARQRGDFFFSGDPMSDPRSQEVKRSPGQSLNEIMNVLQSRQPTQPLVGSMPGQGGISPGYSLEGGGGAAVTMGGPYDLLQDFARSSEPAFAGMGPSAQDQARMSRDPRYGAALSNLYGKQNMQQQMQRFLEMMMGGRGGGLPTRESLLDPRLSDIERTIGRSREQILNQAGAQGRSVTAAPIQRRLSELAGTETTERQRAMGDVDLMLAQLGMGQQGQMMQVLMQLMGMMR